MILTLITLGKYFEARAKGKTTDAIAQLMDLSPKTAIRRNVDGAEEEVPVEQVRPGDILIVRAGAGVPVDGVVVEGAGTVDESVITGESVPVEKGVGAAVTGATVNRTGWFAMRSERVGADTVLAGIVRMVDEATSSIDTRTELLVQRGMDALMKGRTVFVIAHRLSTVQNSDAIMVLDHGRIIERGTHDDLIAQKGTYYQLYTGAFELE